MMLGDQRLDQLFHSPEIARDLGNPADDDEDKDGDDEGGER